MYTLSAFPTAVFPLNNLDLKELPLQGWLGKPLRTWTQRTHPVKTGKAGWVMRDLRFYLYLLMAYVPKASNLCQQHAN